MAGHVFVSYSRADEAYVGKLVDYLQDLGVTVWVDQKLEQTDRWLKVIRNKIDTCGAFVAVMTRASENSDMVQNEILLAQKRGKNVFALLLEGQPFWHLQSRQFESVVGGRMPSPGFVAKLRESIRATQAHSGKAATTSSPSGVGFLVAAGAAGLLGTGAGLYAITSLTSRWVLTYLCINAGIAGYLALGLKFRWRGTPFVGAWLAAWAQLVMMVITLAILLWRIVVEHQGVGWQRPSATVVGCLLFLGLYIALVIYADDV